ncbi:egg cell-secreted protein 1.4-like [Aristolochia californica]|uniref:egg cell-secreted protein 1.4-like n=1 Tax=Aristolochia californica TaxID=171875 RepID=UPI0035E1DCC7
MAFSKLAFAMAIVYFLAPITARQLQFQKAHDLAARIQAEGGLTECLNALYELRSCTNEIILFFVNGESYIGRDCCRAIRVITRHCWPSLLSSIGFTAEEGDILRGYCDASASTPFSPAQSPATAAASLAKEN